MRTQFLAYWGVLGFVCGLFRAEPVCAAPGDQRAAEVIEAHGPLSVPANRAQVVEEMRLGEEARQTVARARAAQMGLPLRGRLPGGGILEIAEFDGDQPLYRRTCNANAAISIGSNVIRASPFFADGTGGTIGLWDASAALSTHQEFGGRVTIKDGSSATENHSSHVAGTLCAVGVSASARGMATNAWVDSYDWNSDFSEMTSRGASTAGETGKINISSHSYGITSGWTYTGGNPLWIWYGSGTTTAGIETDFGTYNTYARDVDAMAYSLPYYLIFWSAGNDRSDNPATGSSVALNPLTPSVTVSYNTALHPPGDGTYRSGYDTISFCALGKNVITVGAVNDAQSGGVRYLPGATMTTFSSWGPTDDGRIKPDVVANGASLYSCFTNNTYGYMSGTSMSTPSAAGLAQQLAGYYETRFPGQAMRASTLKGLLIHTADDRGTVGPDYAYGWGLLNGKAAADVIASVSTNPFAPRLSEQTLTTSVTTRAHRFTWDGVSPIRLTLCWTDPAGVATTTSDSRDPRLVNNLNLRLVGPTGTQHFPYVMPFVGTWTTNTFSAVAVTGTNNTDNVEQVLVTAPPAAGTYEAVVSFSGILANSQQAYSLLISGSAPSAPNPQAVIPNVAESGITALTVSGELFAPGATVTFFRSGYGDVAATVSSATTTSIACSVDVTAMAAGPWAVRVTNPDNKVGTLAAALTVINTLAAQDFDPDAPGWTTSVTLGTPPSGWVLSSADYHTPSNAYRITCPAELKTDNLISEGVAIPSGAQDLLLHFWHTYTTESYDGGILEVSPNNGVTWYGIGEAHSGATFVAGGYANTTETKNGRTPAELAGMFAWNGSNGAFTEVVVSLDSATFAGQTLRARWRMSTDSKNGPGTWFWAVDSVRLTGYVPPPKGTVLLLF